MDEIQFTGAGLAALEKRYRNNLVNGLSGFKSANLIGTCDKEGKTNLSIVSSCFHLGSNPPLQGFIIRPNRDGDTLVPRHTLENIEATGFYTINNVTKDIFKQAHQCGARYDRDISEFKATGLGEDWLEGFSAPFVKESSLKLGMRLLNVVPIKENGTFLIIGKIEKVILPKNSVSSEGVVDIESLGSLGVNGLDIYIQGEKVARLSYPKVDKTVEEI